STGAEPTGVEPGGAESGCAEPREPLSPQLLREWFTQQTRLRSGAAGAGDSTTGDRRAGGAGATVGAGGTGGAAAAGPACDRTRGIGAAGTGGVGGAGAGDPTEPGAAGAGGAGAGGNCVGGAGAGGAEACGAGARGTGAGGARAGGAGAVDPGAGGAGAGGAGGTGAGGTVRQRPYFPASPQPVPSPYTEETGGLRDCRESASRPASPVCTGCRVPRLRPPPVPGTHAMALCSSIPLRVLLAPPPESSLPAVPDPDALVAESESASPPSVEGECALGTDVLKDRQEDFECLAAAGAAAAVFSTSFKARYVARGFSQRHGVDYVKTFSPTPKMTTLWVLLHVAAQRNYDLRRPVYGLRQAPREWHDTLRTTLAALGFTPSIADPSLFLRIVTLLPPFYVLMYVLQRFLSLCPTELTVDLLEENLAAAEKSNLAVGASRGDRRTPFFEGCSPVPLLPSVASAAAVDLVGTEEVGAAFAPSGICRNSRGKGSKSGGGGGGGSSGGGGGGRGGGGGGGSGSGGVSGGGGVSGNGDGGGGGSGSGGGGGGGGGSGQGAAAQRGGFGGSQRQQQLRSRETQLVQQLCEWYAGRGRSRGAGPCTYVLCIDTYAIELPRWHDLLRQNVPIFDLDVHAILATMYAIAESAEGDYYLSVPLDPGIAAAALGASASAATGTGASAAPGAGASALTGTAPTESLHTFTFDSGASRSFFRDSTTLTPLSRPVAVSLADPSRGQVLAYSSTVLPCPTAPSGLLSGLHLPSFSTNLVSGADLQDAWVAASSQVFAAASRSSPASAPCSCRPLSHETLLWHHRLGHPSLPRLRGMASCALVSGLPRSLPPLPPGPAPTCGHERYFLLVVDDYSRYTTVFPLHSKGEIPEVLIDWIHGARCQISESFNSDHLVLRLHSNRGGEFSSDLLRAFCRSEGIRQTFTLPASPHKNGIAERRIGMVMDVARTSMIHVAAPHFLWPFAVQYAAHQINLQPRVSLPETTPTLWGSRAFVRDTTTDKLSSRAIPCVFLRFPPSTRYHLFPYRTASLPPPPPLFLAPDPSEPVEVAVDSGATRGAEPASAGTGGAGTAACGYCV
ncbi:unnamed protein product, partial [Closterium sp. NIES-53]